MTINNVRCDRADALKVYSDDASRTNSGGIRRQGGFYGALKNYSGGIKWGYSNYMKGLIFHDVQKTSDCGWIAQRDGSADRAKKYRQYITYTK